MLGLKWLNTREAFQTPVDNNEVIRVMITEHGKKVLKQGTLVGVVFGVGSLFVLNRFGSNNLKASAADTVAKAAEAVEHNAEKVKR